MVVRRIRPTAAEAGEFQEVTAYPDKGYVETIYTSTAGGGHREVTRKSYKSIGQAIPPTKPAPPPPETETVIIQKAETTEGRVVTRERGESFNLLPGEELRMTGAETYLFTVPVGTSREEVKAAARGETVMRAKPGYSLSAAYSEKQKPPMIQAPWGRISSTQTGTFEQLGPGPEIGPAKFSALTRGEEKIARRITASKAARVEAARRSKAAEEKQLLGLAAQRFTGMTPAEKIAVRGRTLLSEEGWALIGAEAYGKGEKIAVRKLAKEIGIKARGESDIGTFTRGAGEFFQSPIFQAEAGFAAPIAFQSLGGARAFSMLAAKAPAVAKGAQATLTGVYVAGKGMSIGQELAAGRPYAALGRGLFIAAEVPAFFAGAGVAGRAAAGARIRSQQAKIKAEQLSLERSRRGAGTVIEQIPATKTISRSTFVISQKGEEAIGVTTAVSRAGPRTFLTRAGSIVKISRLKGAAVGFKMRAKTAGTFLGMGKQQKPAGFVADSLSVQRGQLKIGTAVKTRGIADITVPKTGKTRIFSGSITRKVTELEFGAARDLSLAGRTFNVTGQAGTISFTRGAGFKTPPGPKLTGRPVIGGTSRIFRAAGSLRPERPVTPDISARLITKSKISPRLGAVGTQTGEISGRIAAIRLTGTRIAASAKGIGSRSASLTRQSAAISTRGFQASLGRRLAPTQLFGVTSVGALSRVPQLRQRQMSGFDTVTRGAQIRTQLRGDIITGARGTERQLRGDTRVVNITGLSTRQLSATRLLQGQQSAQFQISLSGFASAPPVAPTRAGFGFDTEIPPIVPPPTGMPGLPFILGVGKPRGKPSRKRPKPSRKYKYTPTLTAAAFGIRGPRPSRVTGLEIRPVGRVKRRRRKK